MEKAFITRSPKTAELQLFKKYLASYRDGSGNYKEKDGSTRADSRQIERCFAEISDGKTTENKAFYDFVIETNEDGNIAVRGASIKSKEISNLIEFKSKSSNLRAHLEISNSAAKDWKLCKEFGLTEDDFREGRYAEKFGEIILKRQEIDRIKSETAYANADKKTKKTFITRDSVYISVLYSPMIRSERKWLISSFSIQLPKPYKWLARSGKSICGIDKSGEVLYEWYALGGSQFKFYPRISDRLHGTNLFELQKPAVETLKAKSNRLFGI